MGWKIEETDSPVKARLKLVYLFPIFLVTLVPICLWVGWVEHGMVSTRMFWRILKTGRP